MKRLHLVVPGLLGPFSDKIPEHVKLQFKNTEFEWINKGLARAECTEIKGHTGKNNDPYYQTLLSLIYPAHKQSFCQLMADFDDIDASKGYFYCADPVHFKAESDHALLLGPKLLAPKPDETTALIECFNQHFLEDKLSLHSNDVNRWYLKSERPLNLSFTALNYALGRDIKHFMPQGDDEIWWRKILNEAQMLFFQHEVNLNRELTGQLAMNGLWLWDLNYQPKPLKMTSPTQLFSENVVAKALAHQAGIDMQFTETIESIESNAVAVFDSLYDAVCYGDINAWADDLTRFCKTDFQRIMALLKTKKIDELNIYPCNGQVFKINRTQGLKFWKQGNIAQYIPEAL